MEKKFVLGISTKQPNKAIIVGKVSSVRYRCVLNKNVAFYINLIPKCIVALVLFWWLPWKCFTLTHPYRLVHWSIASCCSIRHSEPDQRIALQVQTSDWPCIAVSGFRLTAAEMWEIEDRNLCKLHLQCLHEATISHSHQRGSSKSKTWISSSCNPLDGDLVAL